MKTPDHIWLINVSPEIVWSSSPDPTGDIDPRDVKEYISAEKFAPLRDKLAAAEGAIKDLLRTYDDIGMDCRQDAWLEAILKMRELVHKGERE